MKRRFFLEKRLHFYLILAVIATTLFSWFNINSYLIILLLLCRLLDGSLVVNLKTAFTNKYFLAYFSVFLLDFIGLFYTHHFYTGWKHMESKATLVAIPFIVCSGPFAGSDGYRRLLSAYCLLLAAICMYCLSMAMIEYRWQHTASVFFYHDLTSAVSVNAIFFSGYVIVALLFLLFSSLSLPPLLSPAGTHRLRNGLIFFFTGIMFLLSSKLLLVFLAVIFIFYLGRNRTQFSKGQFSGLALLALIGILTLALTRNPVSRRYQETLSHYSGKIYTEFNGINLRLLQWKFAYEILNENHAWAFGVSAGDSQELLDQKYLAAGMSQGYLGYNFHNQYIEVLVRSGLVGSCIFLLAIAGMIGLARSAATVEAAFTVTLALLVMGTESALEMQQTLFLFSFFPLLTASQSSYRTRWLRYSPPSASATSHSRRSSSDR